jgi:hypothetical protein
LLTTCVNGLDVTGKQLESPVYVAVMLWLPAESDDVVNVATPPDVKPVPINVAPL